MKMLMVAVLSVIGLIPYVQNRAADFHNLICSCIQGWAGELGSFLLQNQFLKGERGWKFSMKFNVDEVARYVTPESCFQQRCLGCSPLDAASPGSPMDCLPSNWVTAEWIHNLGHPPPSTDSRVPIEYRCLKMVATPDDKTLGNTVDSIRGCIPKVQVDSVCLALKALERARGHSDARCFTCYGNNCNSAPTTKTLSYILILACFIYYLPLR